MHITGILPRSNSQLFLFFVFQKKASEPVLYIIAYNSGGTIKDVTRRYCPNWLTVTRKQRVDENWWSESLAPWKEQNTVTSKAEDEMLLQRYDFTLFLLLEKFIKENTIRLSLEALFSKF